jgi:hypothetical protein
MKDINHYGQLSSRFFLQLNLVLIFTNILSKPKTGSKKWEYGLFGKKGSEVNV